MLSAKLVEFIATSADISAFVAQSDRTLDYNKVRLCDPNLHPLLMIAPTLTLTTDTTPTPTPADP